VLCRFSVLSMPDKDSFVFSTRTLLVQDPPPPTSGIQNKVLRKFPCFVKVPSSLIISSFVILLGPQRVPLCSVGFSSPRVPGTQIVPKD
jgi:hypothetical protein